MGTDSTPPIGAGRTTFIGAGQMGMPMVRRLAAAGRDLTVFARRQEVRDRCEALGAAVTPDLAESVADADVVIVCLFSDAQLVELAVGPSGFVTAMKAGALVVSHTTGSPASVRSIADHGVRIVDAPVSGSAQDIDDGHVTVMLGGAPADLDEAAAVVAAYGDPILRLGPLGSAQGVKLLNNALFAAQIQLAGEVVRLAGELGVDAPTVAATIQRSSGASYAMGLVEMMGSIETLAEGAGPFLSKDVAVVRSVAAELGLDLGLLGHVNDHGPVTFDARTTD